MHSSCRTTGADTHLGVSGFRLLVRIAPAQMTGSKMASSNQAQMGLIAPDRGGVSLIYRVERKSRRYSSLELKGIFPCPKSRTGRAFVFWGEYYSVLSEIFIIHNIIIMLFHFFGYFYVSTSMSGIHKDVSIFVFLLVFWYLG